MGLDLPRAAGRGPEYRGTEALFQSSHTSLRDLPKGSHALSYPAILVFSHISNHQDILAHMLFFQPTLPFPVLVCL